MTEFYAFAITGINFSPSVLPTASDSGSGISFVLLSQVDSPGNDYSRIGDLSFEDCRSRCEADGGCNAFTYNHARGVCLLKRAANQWTTFLAWGTTGIKLSSLPTKENAATTRPSSHRPLRLQSKCRFLSRHKPIRLQSKCRFLTSPDD